MRHVWGAASREVPPAHPNHNLDGFRVLLKTLRGFVFTLRPTCLWRARSASLQQLRGLCSAGGARSTSFGELLGSRLPLEAALPQPPSPPSESFSGFGCRWRRFSTSLSFGCCWRRLLNLLRKSSSGFCRWRRSLNLLQIARSTSLHFGAAEGALAQPPSTLLNLLKLWLLLEALLLNLLRAAAGGARSTSFGELFRLPLETLLNLLELSLLLEALAQPPWGFSCRLTRDLLRRAPWASIALPVQWPFYQGRPLAPHKQLLTASRPRFRPRPPDCKLIKAAPTERGRPRWPVYQGQPPNATLASLSRPAPTRRADPPRSGLRRPNPLLRRTSSLSTAGRSLQSRPAPTASLSRTAPMAALSRALASLSRPAPTRRADP